MINSPIIFFLNTHGVFLLYLIVLSYLWFIKKSKEEAIHILISAVVAGAVALITKDLFNIPRPYMVDGVLPLAGDSVHTSSFLSLHSTLAFCLATTVALHQRKMGIILFLAAALVAMGRVLAFVHYPVDVVAGAILGTAVALLLENLRFPKHKRS